MPSVHAQVRRRRRRQLQLQHQRREAEMPPLTPHAGNRATLAAPQIGPLTQVAANLALYPSRAIRAAFAAPTPARFLSMWMEMALTLRTCIAAFSSTLEKWAIHFLWLGLRLILTTPGSRWTATATGR